MTVQIRPEDVQRVRAWRAWTQQDLADELDTDAVTVSRWERGVTHPRPATQRRLARLIVEAGPQGTATLVEDATTRIRELERALRQMQELKRRLKPVSRH